METSSGTFGEQSRLSNKTLKCTSRFHWLISLKLVLLVVGDKSSWCFYNVCFGGIGSLATYMAKYQATRLKQLMCSLQAAT